MPPYLALIRMLRKTRVPLSSVLAYPIRRRLPHARAQLTMPTGAVLTAPPDEPLLTLVEEIWAERGYEPPGLKVAPGDWIVDVGANVGVFATWAGATYPDARLACVEPSPRAVGALKRNLHAAGLSDARVLEVACGGRARVARLNFRGADVMSTLFERDIYGSEFSGSIEVDVLTLEQVFDAAGVDRCALLKLDCEGGEYEILYAAPSPILERISAIALEWHIGMTDDRPEDLAAYLDRHGFEMTWGARLDQEGGHLYGLRR